MRPVLALLICVACVGSVQGFMWFVDSVPIQQAQVIVREPATGKFTLEVTLSFDALPDEFTDAPAALLRFEDEIIFESKERLSADSVHQVNDIKVFKSGANEIFFAFSCSDDDLIRAKAVRMVIRQDDRVIADNTHWSQPGDLVEGTMTLEVSPSDVGG